MTSNFCLEHDGHAIKFTPFFLKWSDFKISKPTLTSFTGSDASDTRIVSPIPSLNNIPIPIEDLTVPERKEPASVIPR